MKINFHLELCGVLLLSLFIGAGCGDQTVREETPETMIDGQINFTNGSSGQ